MSDAILDDVAKLRADAASAHRHRDLVEDLGALEAELLGKRAVTHAQGRAGAARSRRRRRPARPSTRPATSCLAHVRPASRARGVERRQRLQAERLDLTEVVSDAPRGHLHLVTQTIEQLEDVFVGLGFTVAEGPEVETDWHNFSALNFPPDHPARDM